jgi:hypothetical protein
LEHLDETPEQTVESNKAFREATTPVNHLADRPPPVEGWWNQCKAGWQYWKQRREDRKERRLQDVVHHPRTCGWCAGRGKKSKRDTKIKTQTSGLQRTTPAGRRMTLD